MWQAIAHFERAIELDPDFALSRMLFAFPLKDPERLEVLRGSLEQLGFPN
jgi:hypothetical protein